MEISIFYRIKEALQTIRQKFEQALKLIKQIRQVFLNHNLVFTI